VTHTGRIPFGLASFVVKKRVLCKGDHCEGEETSPILRREVCVIYVIGGLQNRIESVGNGFDRCPAAIVSMQELDEKESEPGPRNKIEEIEDAS
jgi:hypothetical protein